MNILITGADGFIGSFLLKELEKKHKVYALVKDEQSIKNGQKKRIIIKDLDFPINYEDLPSKIDVIIHLAQANSTFPDNANKIFNVNTVSTQKLLDYGRKIGISKFIFASSGSVYGSGSVPFKEQNQPVCNNFYSYTKYASELLIHQYKQFFSTVIFRLFTPYGPRQKKRLIPGLINKVNSGLKIDIFNQGCPRLNPIYISDLIKVFKKSLSIDGHFVLNIGGKQVYSIKEMTEIIAQVYKKEAKYEYLQDEKKSDLIGEITFMEKILGFSPVVDLMDGINNIKNETQ